VESLQENIKEFKKNLLEKKRRKRKIDYMETKYKGVKFFGIYFYYNFKKKRKFLERLKFKKKNYKILKYLKRQRKLLN
jgi:hypothetical protein